MYIILQDVAQFLEENCWRKFTTLVSDRTSPRSNSSSILPTKSNSPPVLLGITFRIA